MNTNIDMNNICDNLDIEDLPDEVWRDIIGFDGSHFVSNYGRVKREQRFDTKGRLLKAKILKRNYGVSKKGYKKNAKVGFGAEDRSVNKYVSILVAESFLGDIPDGFCVVHLDKDVTNDKLENLKITTYTESLKIDYQRGKKSDWGFGVRGNIGKSKKVLQLDKNGNVIAEFESLGEIQKKLNFNKQPISNMCNGRWRNKPHYTVYGYKWRFADEE